MKKRILTVILALALAVSSSAMLLSCDKDNGKGGNNGASSRDAYALSLVSSIGYLSEGDGASRVAGVSLVKPAAAVRPEYISDADAEKIGELISLFGNILSDGGIDEEVKENTSESPAFSEYKLVMSITLHDENGNDAVYTLYFNEVAKNTEKEVDDGIEEIEESTRFEGVALFGEEIFAIRGEREVETEGAETETEISFRTYKTTGGDLLTADEKNYVEVEKSSEMGELEYEYTFVKDGRVVKEIELEYEEGPRGAEISFESEGGDGELSFEIKKSAVKGGFEVEFEKNGKKEKITVSEESDGSYKLTYPNGFEEFVNKS